MNLSLFAPLFISLSILLWPKWVSTWNSLYKSPWNVSLMDYWLLLLVAEKLTVVTYSLGIMIFVLFLRMGIWTFNCHTASKGIMNYDCPNVLSSFLIMLKALFLFWKGLIFFLLGLNSQREYWPPKPSFQNKLLLFSLSLLSFIFFFPFYFIFFRLHSSWKTQIVSIELQQT